MTTSRLVTITVVAFVVGVGLDLLIGYSPVPGYGAAIGLFGCLGLILVAKKVVAPLVDRPESHDPEETPPDIQAHVRPDLDAQLGLRSGAAGDGPRTAGDGSNASGHGEGDRG